MSDLDLEDFKQVLLDLYLAQREVSRLRFQLAQRDATEEGEADS